MRHLLLVLLCLNSLVLSAQPTVSGHWAGVLMQPSGGFATRYHYSISLEASGPTTYEGVSRIVPFGHPDNVGIMRLRAEFKGDALFVEEYAIDSTILDGGYVWCLKSFELPVVREGDSLHVKGPVRGMVEEGRPCSALSTELWLHQPLQAVAGEKLAGRELRAGREVKVASPRLTLSFLDDLLVDGDSISVNYNGAWLVKNLLLAHKPHVVEVTLVEGRENVLVMHALNLGRYTPNTAAVIIDDGVTRQKIGLSSDLGFSDALTFRLK